MKRLRVSRQLGQARPGATPIASRQPFYTPLRCQSSTATASTTSEFATDDFSTQPPPSNTPLPSPPQEKALESAKLAALHARLSLSKKVPLQTLARSLVTSSADPNATFNNANLSFLGSTILNYHVLEYIVCKWPRLPMAIVYATLRAYAGPEALQQVAKRWGIDTAAAPGEEVDPGLLQWSANADRVVNTRWGYVRAEAERTEKYRRGMSSRVILDDAFGDQIGQQEQQQPVSDAAKRVQLESEAFMTAVQAIIGSTYTHCGRDAAKSFVKSHILSRQFDPSVLFQFRLPTKELAMLCAREGFQAPVARLESETGRNSRTPVYVVGIYSGNEKLGEGTGPSLDIARRKASMNSLKSWYLYSPGNKVRVPSDTFEHGAQPWKAPHIDIGEII